MFKKQLFNRMMLSVAVLAAPALLVGFGFHLRLTKSFPAKGEVVAISPDSLQLWFSQKTDINLTRAILIGPDSERVPLSKATRASDDEKSVIIHLERQLTQAEYTVRWQAGSPDGHIVDGKFGFTYDPTEADSGTGLDD